MVTGVGATVVPGAVALSAGITRIAPDAVVTTRVVPPPGWRALLVTMGRACFLMAVANITRTAARRRGSQRRRGRDMAIQGVSPMADLWLDRWLDGGFGWCCCSRSSLDAGSGTWMAAVR